MKSYRTRLWGTCVLLSLGVAAVGCGHGNSLPTPSGARAEVATPESMASQLRERLRMENPDRFGGVYLEGAQVVLLLTGDIHDRAALAMRLGIPEGRVTVRGVVHTESELQNITMRITANIPEWQSQGIDVVAVGPDVRQNVVRVVTATKTSAAAVAARTIDQPVTVVVGPEYHFLAVEG